MYRHLVPRRHHAAYESSASRERVDRVLQRMERAGYSASTMASRATEWLAFEAACARWRVPVPAAVDAPTAERYLRARLKRAPTAGSSIKATLRQFLEADFVPGTQAAKRRRVLTPLYEQFVPEYLAFLRQHRGIREPRSQEIYLRDLCVWLHQREVGSFQAFTLLHARAFLADQSRLTRASLAGVTSILRRFVSYLHLRGVVAEDFAARIEAPRVYSDRKLVATLGAPDVERLLARCDRSRAIGKRDYLVLLLAARYGMRPSDVRALTLDDVRWREGKIAFVQSKTQQPTELPLLPEVSEALVDYLRHGRPTTEAREVIVRHVPPFRAVGRHNAFWFAMDACARRARLTGQPRGLRRLRHAAATNLMRCGVPMAQIAAVLGHRVQASTRRYLAVDLEGLRSAALSERELLP